MEKLSADMAIDLRLLGEVTQDAWDAPAKTKRSRDAHLQKIGRHFRPEVLHASAAPKMATALA